MIHSPTISASSSLSGPPPLEPSQSATELRTTAITLVPSVVSVAQERIGFGPQHFHEQRVVPQLLDGHDEGVGEPGLEVAGVRECRPDPFGRLCDDANEDELREPVLAVVNLTLVSVVRDSTVSLSAGEWT